MTDRDAILRKIRALLQKTVAKGCLTEEALAAHAKARKLIDEYQVSHEELYGTAPRQQQRAEPEPEPEPERADEATGVFAGWRASIARARCSPEFWKFCGTTVALLIVGSIVWFRLDAQHREALREQWFGQREQQNEQQRQAEEREAAPKSQLAANEIIKQRDDYWRAPASAAASPPWPPPGHSERRPGALAYAVANLPAAPDHVSTAEAYPEPGTPAAAAGKNTSQPKKVRTVGIRPDNPDEVARPRLTAPASPPGQTLPPTPTTTAGYVVILSSQRSEADAQAVLRSMQAKFPQQMGDRESFVRRADAKGIYYRALVGPFGSAGEANQFCSNLEAAGGQCIVQKN